MTRNCSTEISRAIQASGLPLEVAYSVASNIPKALFRNLLQSSLVRPEHSSPQKLEANKLLYFKSSKEIVDIALALVAKEENSRKTSLSDYFKRASSSEHFDFLLHRAKSDKKLLYALYFLEDLRLSQLRVLRVQEHMKNNAENRQWLEDAHQNNSKLQHNYRFIGSFLVHEDYGVPQTLEVAQTEELFKRTLEKDLIKVRENLLKDEPRKGEASSLEIEQKNRLNLLKALLLN